MIFVGGRVVRGDIHNVLFGSDDALAKDVLVSNIYLNYCLEGFSF